MITRISENEFIQTFDRMGRTENFTIEARRALFEYYEQLEDDLGEQIEFDPIAICCDWAEYKNPVEVMREYGFSCEIDSDDGEETDEQIIEHLRDCTAVIEFHGGIIVAAF